MTLPTERPMWLFHGKEGKNNRRIIELLVQHEAPMIVYEICKRLGMNRKNYPTVLYRTKNLEKYGILEIVGETRASKTHSDSPLYQLSSMGLAEAVWNCEGPIRQSAIERCRKRISGPWDTFWELYAFDAVKDRSMRHRLVSNWVKSDEGIVEILRFFGHSILQGEAQALLTFRRMLDLGVILLQSEGDFVLSKLGELELAGDFVQALTYLGGIALDHPKLRKLHDAVRDVDGPLYSRIKSQTYEQMVSRLSGSVSSPIARKLAMTPFLRDFPLALMDMTEHHFTDLPLDEVIGAAVDEIKEAMRWNRNNRGIEVSTVDKKRAAIRVVHEPTIQKVVLEKGRLSVVTTNPSVISREWLRQSAVYVIDDGGRVKPLRKERPLEEK